MRHTDGRSCAIMIFTTQNRSCHPERSEGSAQQERPFAAPSRSLPLSEAKGSGLRLTQGDDTLPILVVTIHYRAGGRGDIRSNFFISILASA